MPDPDRIPLFVHPLTRQGIRHLISGSVAAMLYGEPRVTHDVDLVVYLTDADILRLANIFPAPDFYLPPPEIIVVEKARQSARFSNRSRVLCVVESWSSRIRTKEPHRGADFQPPLTLESPPRLAPPAPPHHSTAMKAAAAPPFISVEDYLAGEPASPIRHEYIGGAVYAMSGASKNHNRISANFHGALDAHFGDSRRCEVFINDLKVRLLIAGEDIFYYPDVVVACDPRDTDPFSLRFPKLIIEVLSPSTEQTDRREKLLAYRSIPTLEEYVIVAQDRIEVTLFRRADGWQPAGFSRIDQTVRLASVDLELPISAIYRRVLE